MRTSACERWITASDALGVGEAIDPEEQAFLRMHESACADCMAESAVWRALQQADAGAPDESGCRRGLIASEPHDDDAEIGRVLAEAQRAARLERTEPRGLGRSTRARRMVVAGLAAAAVVAAGVWAVGVAASWRARSSTTTSRLAEGADPATIAPAAPAGEPPASPAPEIAPVPVASAAPPIADPTTPGYRCDTLGSAITYCVADGSRVASRALAAPRRVLTLTEGRVVVALGPQPAGSSFAIATPFGRATAAGTVFSVDVGPSQAWVRVERGNVEVARAGTPGASAPGAILVRSGQRLRLDDRSRPAPLPAAERARDIGALSMEVAASDVALLDKPRALPPSTPSRSANVPSLGAPRAAGGDGAPRPVETVDDPSSTLARARLLLAQGDFRGAAQAYERVYQRAPSSGAGAAALVSLGDLRLSELGDPQGALTAFDAYLARGGSLATEAQFGRIRALRALGRTGEERAAAHAFLVDHPTGPRADAIRRSLQN